MKQKTLTDHRQQTFLRRDQLYFIITKERN